ncbi:MAG: hypothetical protein ACYS74_17635 [Planctomycetota bacterium]
MLPISHRKTSSRYRQLQDYCIESTGRLVEGEFNHGLFDFGGDWRTRLDPFDQDDWCWVEEVLESNDGIEAKTLFEVLQREHPGRGNLQLTLVIRP